MKIPLLPGNFIPTTLREDHKKSHLLEYINGYPIQKRLETSKQALPEVKRPINKDALIYGDKQFHKNKTGLRFVPSFIAFDKAVLSFDAYFIQKLFDSRETQHQRTVKIYYYLEDGSICVSEPKVENSGFMQGTLIKRHRIMKENGDYFTHKDFQVGGTVEFYKKQFNIVACDEYTRKFLEQQDIKMGQNGTIPEDAYIKSRIRKSSFAHGKHLEDDALYRFQQFDRKVLRFYCLWDDSKNMFGDSRQFIFHYYLVDDTIEVVEILSPNCGRDHNSVLLRRQKLIKTKNHDYSSLIAHSDVKHEEITTWKELRVGGSVDVFGRQFQIYDCDNFTREYYNKNLGVEQPKVKVEPTQKAQVEIKQQVPPYTGYGTIEDSLQSCRNLVLKPPKKDFVKILANEHNILRFSARLLSNYPADKERKFMISFRMSDDTLSIYEVQGKASGFIGGKFLESTRALLPTSSLSDPEGPKYYEAHDLYVGKEIEVFRHKFVLVDADEYVFSYMEKEPEIYTFSNVKNTLEKAKGLGVKAKLGMNGVKQRAQVLESMKANKDISSAMNHHEMVTLCRAFETTGAKYMVDLEKMP